MTGSTWVVHQKHLSHSDSGASGVNGSSPETEIAWITRAKAGDHEAFRQLLKIHDQRVMGVILRFTANRFDREDLYQEVFTACYQALPSYSGNASFFTWLYRVAMNTCISFSRRQQSFEPELEQESREHDWEKTAKLLAISKAQDKLNGAQRISFHLYYIEQWTVEEIAAVLESSVGSTKIHLQRARDKIRADKEIRKWKIEI